MHVATRLASAGLNSTAGRSANERIKSCTSFITVPRLYVWDGVAIPEGPPWTALQARAGTCKNAHVDACIQILQAAGNTCGAQLASSVLLRTACVEGVLYASMLGSGSPNQCELNRLRNIERNIARAKELGVFGLYGDAQTSLQKSKRVRGPKRKRSPAPARHYLPRNAKADAKKRLAEGPALEAALSPKALGAQLKRLRQQAAAERHRHHAAPMPTTSLSQFWLSQFRQSEGLKADSSIEPVASTLENKKLSGAKLAAMDLEDALDMLKGRIAGHLPADEQDRQELWAYYKKVFTRVYTTAGMTP